MTRNSVAIYLVGIIAVSGRLVGSQVPSSKKVQEVNDADQLEFSAALNRVQVQKAAHYSSSVFDAMGIQPQEILDAYLSNPDAVKSMNPNAKDLLLDILVERIRGRPSVATAFPELQAVSKNPAIRFDFQDVGGKTTGQVMGAGEGDRVDMTSSSVVSFDIPAGPTVVFRGLGQFTFSCPAGDCARNIVGRLALSEDRRGNIVVFTLLPQDFIAGQFSMPRPSFQLPGQPRKSDCLVYFPQGEGTVLGVVGKVAKLLPGAVIEPSAGNALYFAIMRNIGLCYLLGDGKVAYADGRIVNLGKVTGAAESRRSNSEASSRENPNNSSGRGDAAPIEPGPAVSGPESRASRPTR